MNRKQKRFVVLLHGVENYETNDELVVSAYVASLKHQGWKDAKYLDRKEKDHVVC